MAIDIFKGLAQLNVDYYRDNVKFYEVHRNLAVRERKFVTIAWAVMALVCLVLGIVVFNTWVWFAGAALSLLFAACAWFIGKSSVKFWQDKLNRANVDLADAEMELAKFNG